MELFFDLVYVFAVTQLSGYLLQNRSAGGALKTGLLLAMVWLLWAYTTWVTNWLDPGRIPLRLLLLALMRAASRPGSARILLWAGAVAVDLAGGAVGFSTPGRRQSSRD